MNGSTPDICPHVLYIIGQLRRGGAEQQLYYLLREWRHCATVVVLEKNLNDAYWVQPIRALGYEVIELQRHGRFDAGRLTSLLHQIRAIQPDIIHLFTDSSSGMYGRLAALLARHPCVIANVRHDPSIDPRWLFDLKRWLLNRHISAVVANSRKSLNYIIEHMGISKDKAHYIPNALDLQRFQQDSSLDARTLVPDDWRDKVLIGSVGSLRPIKDPNLYVRVARRVVDVCPDARFLHVGKGPLLSAVEALRDELGLINEMQFLGERFDVPQLLQAMDIFVMTSRNEGMPNGAMEAMAMRLPCVVTDAGDSREVVRDGETGFVVPVGDEDALAERILRLINDPTLRQRFGEQGWAVIQGFSTREMAERYRRLYNNLVDVTSR